MYWLKIYLFPNQILAQPVGNPKQWEGILPKTKLLSEYANKLRAMSSPLPESYRTVMRENGYNIAQGAFMMIPGMTQELVQMGFVMSMATPISRSDR